MAKFKRGDRVKISDEGVAFGIAPRGTKGTVLHCLKTVRVHIDGYTKGVGFRDDPDFWDAA